MKNIKNSLKKLSKNSSSDQNSHKTENVSAENSSIAVKRQNYKNLTPNSISYKGYDFPDDIVNRRVLENLQDLEIRDDDVFLITYPANGAHLLEDVVQNLLNESMQKIHQQQKIERERQNGSMIIESETTSETKSNQLDNSEEDGQMTLARLESANIYGHIRWLKSIRSSRLLSSNLPFDLLPKQTQSQLSSSSTKIIYQCRNCKDHLVSYYYHHRLKGISIPLNDFIDLYLDGYLFYGDYFDHVLSFWQLSKLYPRNVLFICYEELQIMTHNMASIIAKFLNLNLSDEEINESIREAKQTKSDHQLDGDELIESIKEKNKKMKKDADGDANKNQRDPSRRLHKFQNVLGDWEHYLDRKQIDSLDRMNQLKFESQKLFLIDSIPLALKQIEKNGRILVQDDSLRNSSTSSESSPTQLSNKSSSKSKQKFQRKLVMTRDEARFIRKKHKVIIIEDEINLLSQHQKHRQYCLRSICRQFRRCIASVCCCFCCRSSRDPKQNFRSDKSQKRSDYDPF